MPVRLVDPTFRRVKSKFREKKREKIAVRGHTRLHRRMTTYAKLRERIAKRKRQYRTIRGRASSLQAQRRRTLQYKTLRKKSLFRRRRRR